MPEFFRVHFHDIAAAAGLVADLSRQLTSHSADLRDIGAIEVGVLLRGAGAYVYLSAGALTATVRAFGVPAEFSKVETLPDDLVCESTDTAPWNLWSHFAAIEGTGFKSLTVGERVEVTYHRAKQDSYRYVAERVRRLSRK